ncbi:MAG: response regulator transcription factor [Desulfitobacterium hafniense]|nr:response regulator transcription factor [Desulfitobacterium hafniense]
MAKVLLIEDDVVIQELVTYNLKREGYDVEVAADGQSGLDKLVSIQPDIILLDLMLPVLDGFEVCKKVRADKKMGQVPIIILSARDEEVDKVIGLELGADDYVTKPFSPRELIARIKARLREDKRISQEVQKTICWGDLELSLFSHIVTIKEQPLNLTAKEFELLHLFLLRPSYVFSREYLLQKIWGYSDGDTRTVDVHICNLRNKLKSLGSVIESVRGVGYRFESVNTKN